jgi:hypothetical protein
MACVIVNLASEYLPDGSFHVYSPNVPGFHVIEREHKRTNEQVFYETALPVLRETMSRRVAEAKVGEGVRFADVPTPIDSFVPDELSRRLRRERPRDLPKQVIAEII